MKLQVNVHGLHIAFQPFEEEPQTLSCVRQKYARPATCQLGTTGQHVRPSRVR
jgi:hypothetical protein